MQLNEIRDNVADQEKGRELDLVDPFAGTPTGIKLTIVGPDSETAHRAQMRLADELADAADVDGRVSAEARDRARKNCLAALIIQWTAAEDGKPVQFNTQNVLKLLRVPWCALQVDTFATDRRNFAPEAERAPELAKVA